jgi:hypothetical protein
MPPLRKANDLTSRVAAAGFCFCSYAGSGGNALRSKLAFSVFVAGVLSGGLRSHPVDAATKTASFAVTTTVEAGCEVSPRTTSSEIGGSGQVSFTPTASVNCTPPVPYLIIVNGASGTRNGVAGLPQTEVATTTAYTNSRSPELFEVWSLPYGASSSMDQTASSFEDFSFWGTHAWSKEAASCSRFDAPPATVTLTIIY